MKQRPEHSPDFSLPGGGRLPPGLRLLRRLLSRGPYISRRVAQSATRRLWLGRLPAMLARYPDGRSFALPARDIMYGQVFVDGAYEPAESAVVGLLLQEGDFAIDVGANHGWYSLLMASRVGAQGLVWAVEPMAESCAALLRNLGLNPGVDVRLLPVALGAGSGATTLYSFTGLPHGHASLSGLGRNDLAGHDVELRSLDALLQGAAGRAPVLIKLDVEGAELDVLRGARQTLRADRPPIWMLEVNHQTSAAFGYRPRDLIDHLLASDRQEVYRVTPDGTLARENDPAAAPHGTTWFVVPECHRDRLAGLTPRQ